MISPCGTIALLLGQSWAQHHLGRRQNVSYNCHEIQYREWKIIKWSRHTVCKSTGSCIQTTEFRIHEFIYQVHIKDHMQMYFTWRLRDVKGVGAVRRDRVSATCWWTPTTREATHRVPLPNAFNLLNETRHYTHNLAQTQGPEGEKGGFYWSWHKPLTQEGQAYCGSGILCWDSSVLWGWIVLGPLSREK